MNIKEIKKTRIKESFLYGNIVSWKFRDTITPIRKTFAYRFKLTFANGTEYPMQKGGYHTKTEALKAKEFTISELHSRKFIPFEYTVKEFFDFWLYYYMIDVENISYSTFYSYRNIIYNYILKIWNPDKKISTIERNDINNVLNSIKLKGPLQSSYTVLRSAFFYAASHQITHIDPAITAIRMKKKAEKKRIIKLCEMVPKNLKRNNPLFSPFPKYPNCS